MQHPLTQLAQDVRTGQDRQYFWTALIPVLAALAGSVLTKKNTGQQSPEDLGATSAADFQQLMQIPQIADLFKLQQAQALRLEPLQQAASQLAFQLMPISARQGVNYFGVPTPQLSSTAPPVQYGSGSAAGGVVSSPSTSGVSLTTQGGQPVNRTGQPTTGSGASGTTPRTAQRRPR